MSEKNLLQQNKIIVILGPTSSGKSDVAIKLAKKLGGEIISADSRQVYQGMDIGTGKVPKSKFPLPLPLLPVGEGGSKSRVREKSKNQIYYSAGIPHHMIDIVDPKTDYNVAKFKRDAEKIIEDILKRGKLPIICGGTGFWIKAIVDNVVFPAVKPNKVLRNQLSNKSAEQLFKMLQKSDPHRAKNIDRHNKVRLIRAIEICKAVGFVPRYKIQDTRYKFLQIGIDISKEKLYQNIKKRLDARFQQGIIKEVKNLREKYKLSWKKIQSFGLGYYWIPLYLKSEISNNKLFEKVYQAEKDYAKRQMTWFRKDRRIKWLDDYKSIESLTKIFIKK